MVGVVELARLLDRVLAGPREAPESPLRVLLREGRSLTRGMPRVGCLLVDGPQRPPVRLVSLRHRGAVLLFVCHGEPPLWTASAERRARRAAKETLCKRHAEEKSVSPLAARRITPTI